MWYQVESTINYYRDTRKINLIFSVVQTVVCYNQLSCRLAVTEHRKSKTFLIYNFYIY